LRVLDEQLNHELERGSGNWLRGGINNEHLLTCDVVPGLPAAESPLYSPELPL
jgi:hypothetical protein